MTEGTASNEVTLPPKNVPLAECFNSSNQYGNYEDSAGALHAEVQAGSCAAGERRAEHCDGGQVAGRGAADAVQPVKADRQGKFKGADSFRTARS